MVDGMSREDAREKHGSTLLERSLAADNTKQRRENKKLKKQLGAQDYLVSQVRDRLEAIGSMPPIAKAPLIIPKHLDRTRELRPVLCIADPHMEEVVDPDETQGMAEWNFDRFLRSTWTMIQEAIDIVDQARSTNIINQLDIFWLGDMVTGEIHPDVYFTNEKYLPDALAEGPFYWAQAVRELSAHFEHITNTCIPGNHGRMDKRPVSKRVVGRNWDTCMYKSTAIATRHLENVEWHIPLSPKANVDVNGWYFLLQHGDRVPQHGGTTPYYGMLRQRSAELAKRIGYRVKDIEKQLAKGLLFDYDIRGHHHKYGAIEERTLLCPSMMGNNEFGLDNIFGHKIPGARLFFVDEKEGIHGDYRINLLDLPEEHHFEVLPSWS